MIALFLAITSWVASLITFSSYEYTNWQCLVSLSLVDLIFMFLMATLSINYIKKRWLCSLMFISVIFLTTFSIVTYMFEYQIINSNNVIYLILEFMLEPISLILSMLVMLVAVTPQKIINGIDDALWSSPIDDFFVSDNDGSYQDIKKGSQK